MRKNHNMKILPVLLNKIPISRLLRGFSQDFYDPQELLKEIKVSLLLLLFGTAA